MVATTSEALRLLAAARSPLEVFGAAAGEDETLLAAGQRTYRRLARLVHPDANPDRVGEATTAFARLTELWATWTAAADPVTLTTRRHGYTLGSLYARGDLANLYAAQPSPSGTAGESSVLVKMPRSPRNNDLLRNEATQLKHLTGAVEARYAAYLPQLVETVRHRDVATGVDRQVNVLARLEGFHTLADVTAAYPAGLDARDAAWMWRRLLVALGAVHRAGVIHGAVVPEHVLVHPGEHGLVLVDFAYATQGDPIAAVIPRYRDWYPAEVAAKQSPTAATDIAMATRVVTTLMGARAPRPLRAFAHGCTLTVQRARPDDAWALLGELDELLGRLYGPRRFRPFSMPTAAPGTRRDAATT